MKISIVTPSFNQGRFIEETILSVLNQDYDNYEHIIIDGCSDDETISILKKYPHLKWISEPDNGQTHAANKGLRMATGDIIGWLNSDDQYFQNVFSEIGSIFQNNPEIQALYGDCHWVDEGGKFIKQIREFPFSLHRLLFYNYIVHPTIFVRREVFDKIGYYRDDFENAMDYEFMIRLAKKFTPVHIPIYIAKMRIHPNCKTHLFSRRQMLENERISEIHHDLYDKVRKSKISYMIFKIWYRLSVHFTEFRSNPIFYSKKLFFYFISYITCRKFKPDYRLGLRIPE